jgi:hypothetical protein
MATTDNLRSCLGRIDRPVGFCATAVEQPILPGLSIDGFGMVALPLDASQARALESRGSLAGYGQGRNTVLDPEVRRVLRFPAATIHFANPAWGAWLAAVTERLVGQLGLADHAVTPMLHELLLYRPGDFFLPHRDGEKVPGMVATLSLQLPSDFQGGAVVVRHQGTEIRFTGDDPAHAFVPQAMAWYADCEHEILPLTRGHRLVLIYNLVLPAGQTVIRAPDFSAEITALGDGLAAWRAEQAAADGLLVVPMQHAYSEDGLRPTWLKGTDRAQAESLFVAAARVGLEAYLALVTYRVMGEPDYCDGENDDPETMEMGEIYDEELFASTWIDATGVTVPLGRMPLKAAHFLDGYDTLTEEVSKQEFEGYTGNAGMELTRWYHRAAMILWDPERTGALLAAAGVSQVIAALEHRLHAAAGGAIVTAPANLARAALERWIRAGHPGYADRPAPGRMAGLLAEVGSCELACQYLGQVLVADPDERPLAGLDALVQRFGCAALSPALAAVWRASRPASLERDAELLAQIAACQDAPCRAAALVGAAQLVRLVVDPSATVLPHGVAVLSHLAQALADVSAEDLGRHLSEDLTPERADPATIQAEALLVVRSRRPTLPPWIHAWSAKVVTSLEQQTAIVPQAPTNHARAGLTACDCEDCRLLDAFLRDPRRPRERFPLRESRRQHLQDIIRLQACDVEATVERRGSPYALVCTKTQASYERALARHRHALAQHARLGAERA